MDPVLVKEEVLELPARPVIGYLKDKGRHQTDEEYAETVRTWQLECNRIGVENRRRELEAEYVSAGGTKEGFAERWQRDLRDRVIGGEPIDERSKHCVGARDLLASL